MRTLKLLTVLLFALGAATVAPAVADGGDAYYYTYFDQHLPLGVDANRLAVRSFDETSLATKLAGHGLAGVTFEPVGVAGWTAVRFTNVEPLPVLVQRLADSGDFDFVSPVFLDARGLPLIITADIFAQLQPDIGPADAAELLAEHADGVIEETDFAGLAGVYRLRLANRSGFDVLDVTNRLADLPEVRFAESDVIMRAERFFIPNDPLFSQQWALDQGNDQDMDAPEAWDITTGDPAVIVAVLDAGIEQGHPDLNQIPGQDFTSAGAPGGGPANQCDNHGTSVAGCIAATIDNNRDIVGVAPGCVVTSAKIGTTIEFFGFCTPFLDAQPSYFANALSWAVSVGARVSNSSLGLNESSIITTAYDNARANGVLNIAATGNDGGSSISYPASLASVEGTGALASTGARASFSNYGSGIAFSAPGESILCTDRTGSAGYAGGDTTTLDGTSFASPYAAGVAALIFSRDLSLTPDEVAQLMYNSCVDLGSAGYDTTYGWGFVNAFNAVQAVGPSFSVGDLNCDGAINAADIDPFVLALTDIASYVAAYPNCDANLADVNADGAVNAADIDPFVTLVVGP